MNLQDTAAIADHSPDQERPLGGYAMLMGTYSTSVAVLALAFRRSGRQLPKQVSNRDLVLMALASQKLARLISRDRVTSVVRSPFTRFQGDAGPGEVNEAARGSGPRRAVGELLVCPHCLGMWTASALMAGHLFAPRATRVLSTTFTLAAASDLIQVGYVKAMDLLEQG